MDLAAVLVQFDILGQHYEITTETMWVGIGLLGQLLFTARFLVQWLVSEKSKQSVIPVAFWYLSIGGSAILLAYAIHRRDPVFILGQSMGSVIYVRNLWLIHAHKKRTAEAANN